MGKKPVFMYLVMTLHLLINKTVQPINWSFSSIVAAEVTGDISVVKSVCSVRGKNCGDMFLRGNRVMHCDRPDQMFVLQPICSVGGKNCGDTFLGGIRLIHCGSSGDRMLVLQPVCRVGGKNCCDAILGGNRLM